MDFAGLLRALMTERSLGVRALARRVPCDPGWVSRLASGRAQPSHQIAARLDEVLRAGGRLTALAAAMQQPPGSQHDPENPVQRRNFMGLASASVLGAVLDHAPQPAPMEGIEAIATALVAYTPAISTEEPPDLLTLEAEVARVKRDYLACRYGGVITRVRALLISLEAACPALDGEGRRQAYRASAEAHHVAASVLFKLGDHGLAWLAADRSMIAAQASEDPLIQGCSARIITHALMAGGHLAAAVATARTQAARLESQVPALSAQSLSVYGALLLRTALAAAQRGDRSTAADLLAEADETAWRIGADHNHRWTAFGPANVQVHRVSAAVDLARVSDDLEVG